jgi:hypothetical protein
MLKNSASMKEKFRRQNPSFPSPRSSSCAVRWLCRSNCQRVFWWTDLLSPVDIIPPWLSVLIYHLGVEKQARWWPQLIDIFSPHRHYHHHHHQAYPISSCVVLSGVFRVLSKDDQCPVKVFRGTGFCIEINMKQN